MAKLTAKSEKELKHRFVNMAAYLTGYYDHIDFRGIDDFNDKAFAYLMEKVKGVNMLDLNESNITNESIALLKNLEYVNEIRAKECYQLNNGCIEDLNKLESVVFLHLKNTSITIDGLLHLKDLSNLKTLMFSADDVEAIKEEILELKTMRTHCELVINAKPTFVNAIDLLFHVLKKFPIRYRLKIQNQSLPEKWSQWLSKDDENQITTETQGTYTFEAIAWLSININDTKSNSNGPDKLEISIVIMELLEDLEFPYQETNGEFSIYLVDKDI